MDYYNIIDETYLKAAQSNVIYPRIKVELMDYNENVLAELQQDISTQDAGSISVNYQQGVRRSCSITLSNIDGEYLPSLANRIWINTKFKVYIGLRIPKTVIQGRANFISTEDTPPNPEITENEYKLITENSVANSYYDEDTYWFSQGIFLLTNPTAARNLSHKTLVLEGVDKFGIFGSETNFKETEGTYFIPAGTTVAKFVKDMLDMDLGNGQATDPQQPIIDSFLWNEVLPQDIEKGPGEYFSDIIIQIANSFSCDVFYDTDGRFNLVKGSTTSTMEGYTSQWDYSDILPDYGQVTDTYNFTEVYNVVRVVANNSELPSYEAIVENRDVTSPTNIQTIGKKIKYVESGFCFTQKNTDDFAKYLLRKYSIAQQALSFESSLLPHLDVNRPITITDSYYQWEYQRFIVQSLTLPISTTGQISVEASNCANIPYYEY